jgi:microcystin-dependent protein
LQSGGTGRVLIGTPTDNGTDALQVNGGINAQVVSGSAQIKYGRTATNAGGGAIGGDATYALRVFTGALAGGLFNVTQTGRTLVGTDTDNGTDTLQVAGNMYGHGVLTLSHDATGASPWFVMLKGATDPNKQLLIGYETTANQGYIQATDSGVGNTAFRLNPNGGNILVHTTTDNGTDALQVAGNITATGKVKESGNAIVPVGEVKYFAFSALPAGFLKCNGATISRTTYADLFSAIGTIFGAGDGSTTFNVPDLRGEFIRGYDEGRGVDSGRTFGSWQGDQLGSHTHTYTEYGAGSSGSFQSGGKYGASTTGSNDTLTTNSAGGNETRPRNVALLACIKY